MVTTENINCAICGQRNIEILYVVNYRRFVQCKMCRLVYIDPWKETDNFYSEGYFTDTNRYIDSNKISELNEIFNKIFNRIERYSKKGRLLDIGCGPGSLLVVARTRGWEVQGVELSLWASNYARKTNNLNVYTGRLEDIIFEHNYFDVVICNHTLEHLDNPKILLSRANRILKTNGLLFIGIPNYGSIMRMMKKSDWQSLLPEQHRWHFTNKTIQVLLRNEGFQIDNIVHINHKPYGGLVKRFLVRMINAFAILARRSEAIEVYALKNNN